MSAEAYRRAPVVQDVNLDDVQWDEFAVDSTGKAIGLLGMLFEDFSSKQLRTICSKLSLKGIKNAKKGEMITRLVNGHTNWTVYKVIQN